MEEEIESQIFYKKDYENEVELRKEAEKFAAEMRKKYPDCMVSKEFYRVENILVRVTTIRQRYKTERILEKEKIRQKEMSSRGRGRGRERSR